MEAGASFCSRCGSPAGGTAVLTEKKLVRPMGNNWIAGVCAGFARFFNVDVTIVRLLWLGSVILVGTGILAYIICWIVMPREYSA